MTIKSLQRCIGREPEQRKCSTRFLLCRPRGGLNDILCQIELCWHYAEYYGRTLIIDTIGSSLSDEFSHYFQPRKPSDKVLFSLPPELIEELNRLSCLPGEVRGRIDTYDADHVNSGFVISSSGESVSLSFDFLTDHEEELLVHHKVGGGILSFQLLPRLTLADRVLALMRERVHAIKGNYVGIHIRNTDLKCDYRSFLAALKPLVDAHQVLVCSDDVAVIHHARKVFGASRIRLSSQPPDTAGMPLHHLSVQQGEGSAALVMDSLVDLMALGRANHIHFAIPTTGSPSGYSLLAEHLCANKYLIDRLLRERSSAPTITPWRLRHGINRLRFLASTWLRSLNT